MTQLRIEMHPVAGAAQANYTDTYANLTQSLRELIIGQWHCHGSAQL